MTKLSVITADDFPVVTVGLRKILEDSGEFEVMGGAASVYSLRALLRHHMPDLLIIDSVIPRSDLAELLGNLRLWAPLSRVMLFCSADEEFTAILGLRSGVKGIISKSAGAEEIIKAARTVALGGTYLSGRASEKLTNYMVKNGLNGNDKGKPNFSSREYMVLRRLTSGDKLSEIARDCNLSPKTVATYRERMMEKIGVKSLAGLIRYALQNDLLSDS